MMRRERKHVVAPGVGRLTEAVQAYTKFYRFVDETIARDVEETGEDLSCAIGCAACCRHVISLSVPEAINLMGEFGKDHFRMKSFKAIVTPKIAKQMILLQKGKTLDDLREQGGECVFLRDDGSCLVHQWRPCICRVRTSFDDPHKCAFPTEEIRRLDVDTIAARFSDVERRVGKDLRLPIVAMPLPIALTFARAAFTDGLYELRNSLKRLAVTGAQVRT
jgi:Fe-S-cluster containining protein